MAQQPLIYYAVTLERGTGWDFRYPMRQQEKWDEHASLMDALVEEGFIILGGPLEDEAEVLLIINTQDAHAIETRFADDPWIVLGVRRIAKIERWKILLDARLPREAQQDGIAEQ